MQKAISIQDRDIQKNEWNTYLKKYSKQYKVYCDEIGIWSIKLNKNLGFIQPYSILNKQLIAVLSFKSPTAKTYFLKKTTKIRAFDLKINQNCIQELSIVFHEKDLTKLESLLSIRKRKKLTKEQKRILAERLRKVRKN